MSKKPAQLSQMFASAAQNQEVFQLAERVEQLEQELRQVRSQQLDSTEREALERQMQELAQQLAIHGGEHQILLEQIYPDPDQPRTVFPKTVIQARVKSLREEGQQSPIVIIPEAEGMYKLFDGELRWRSASQAGLMALRAVFLTQEALDRLDKTAIFDRQLTTSLQSEKLHPFDLAKGLVKLMTMRYPELSERVDSIPSQLNATIQRLRRTGTIRELETIAIADLAAQQQWIENVCSDDKERWILEVILSKQLNPVSINSNVFPLLDIPEDLQSVIQTEGLEGSKVLELKKISGKNLNIEEDAATDIRVNLTADVIEQKLTLNQIRLKVREILQASVKQIDKQPDFPQRLESISFQIKQAKVWQDPQKKRKLEKLLSELEKLLERQL